MALLYNAAHRSHAQHHWHSVNPSCHLFVMVESVFNVPRLTRREFRRLADLIEERAGIRMPANKQTMLEGRLRHRLRKRNMEDFNQYCRFLFEEGGLDKELSDLIDAITTNKTEFFREPQHFDFLTTTALPALIRRGIGVVRPLRVWSAGCSIGAEPYTLAMVLSEQKRSGTGFGFRILGTDICHTVLKTATSAIYPEEMAEPIPIELRRRYLLKSVERRAQLIRIAPEIRSQVEFKQLNFMDADYHLTPSPDIVFCRNVIIYFDNKVRTVVLNRICRNLVVGGYLFMGHSETISNFDLPLRPVGSTVYVKE
ncbi:Chemotaxis protein methyltransferase [Gammaproteobacteria bacterium]